MNYEELLRKAMEKIPKKVVRSERFKIPRARCEYVGNKTYIRNFKEIVDTLRRPPEHLSKYLFKELATPGSIEGKSLVLQRKVPFDILQKKIESYVKEFVLCKVCGEPDTKLVKEKRITFARNMKIQRK